MRTALELSLSEIDEIHEAWMAGDSSNKICGEFHHGTQQIRDLAKSQGWPERDLLREALPAGHSSTWGAICGNVSGAAANFANLMASLGGVDARQRNPHGAAR